MVVAKIQILLKRATLLIEFPEWDGENYLHATQESKFATANTLIYEFKISGCLNITIHERRH